MTRKKIFIIVSILCVAFFSFRYFFSPLRDLEMCFGGKHLPASISNVEIHVDSWTDYVVRAYFIINPVDFPKLLENRNYRVVESVEGIPLAIQSSYPDWFPNLKSDEIYYAYILTSEAGTRSKIWANSDRSKVAVLYSAD